MTLSTTVDWQSLTGVVTDSVVDLRRSFRKNDAIRDVLLLLLVLVVAVVVMVVLLAAVMDLHHNIREVLSQLEGLEVFAVLQVAAGHRINLSIGIRVEAATASRRWRRRRQRRRRRRKRRRTVYCETAAVCSSRRLRKATKKGIKPSGCW